MTKKSFIEDLYSRLSTWIEDVNTHELTDMVELVEKAKSFASAAESIPEEKVKQFVSHFQGELVDFYHLNQKQADNSIYLGLMSESFWQVVAKITDKAQVEWVELLEDFEHQGDYKEGDIIGFGMLSCKNCQHRQEYSHLSEVMCCPECQHKHFRRIGFAP